MDPNPIQTAARHAQAKRRLGPDAVCVLCGIANLSALVPSPSRSSKRTSRRPAHAPALTARSAATATRASPSSSGRRTPTCAPRRRCLDRLVAVLRGLATFFRALGEHAPSGPRHSPSLLPALTAACPIVAHAPGGAVTTPHTLPDPLRGRGALLYRADRRPPQRRHAVAERTTGSRPASRTTSRGPDARWPEYVLTFDTETTVDAAQALLFGCYRFGRWTADRHNRDARRRAHPRRRPRRDGSGRRAVLKAYAAAERGARRSVTAHAFGPDGGSSTTCCGRPRTRRVRSWSASTAVRPLPRRGRGRGRARDVPRRVLVRALGLLGQDGPCVAREQVSPARVRQGARQQAGVHGLLGPARRGRGDLGGDDGSAWRGTFRGHFLDLRTLVFALTAAGIARSACEAFGVADGKMQPRNTGGSRRATSTTAGRTCAATQACWSRPPRVRPAPDRAAADEGLFARLDRQGVPRAMGIAPALRASPTSRRRARPRDGGLLRRPRRVPHPAHAGAGRLLRLPLHVPDRQHADGALGLLTAEALEVVDATEEVRALLDGVTVDGCFDPALGASSASSPRSARRATSCRCGRSYGDSGRRLQHRRQPRSRRDRRCGTPRPTSSPRSSSPGKAPQVVRALPARAARDSRPGSTGRTARRGHGGSGGARLLPPVIEERARVKADRALPADEREQLRASSRCSPTAAATASTPR